MRIAKNYSVQKICGRTVLIPVGQSAIDGAKILTLNDTAEWIVKNIMNGISIDELHKKATEHFQASPEETGMLKNSINAFIEELSSNKLIAE